MARRNRLILSESTWICGEAWTRTLQHATSNLGVLRERGTKILLLKNHKDKGELEQIRRLLWQRDVHVILSWLLPNELAALYPLLRDRKNFSVVADDWWVLPYWFMREAEYILFRKYHGIAVRLGQTAFVNGPKPPLLLNPFPQVSKYSAICSLLRPAALAVSPFMNVWNWWQRQGEEIVPEKYLYLPFAIDAADVPLGTEKPRYDFVNTAGTLGIWLMRDPHVPFQYTFANLYHDRKRLIDSIAQFENNPFAFYDCRREKNYFLPWKAYVQKSQQSRYAIVSGGLHDAALPKYLEYVCMGTPMIGRGVPFERPWLEDVLFPVEMMRLPPKQLKPFLHEAINRYPVLRENCLKWREPLLKLYNFNTLLDMLQGQADGKPIPPDYLKMETVIPSQRVDTNSSDTSRT